MKYRDLTDNVPSKTAISIIHEDFIEYIYILYTRISGLAIKDERFIVTEGSHAVCCASRIWQSTMAIWYSSAIFLVDISRQIIYCTIWLFNIAMENPS